MPSSHAQFVAYFAVTLALFLLVRHQPTHPPSATHRPLTGRDRAGLSVLALGAAAAVAVSRIYLSYHTPKQVLVGVSAGVVFALLWFVLTSWLRRSGLLGWLLDLPLARMLRVRDLVLVEDLAQAGWERWEQRRRDERQRHQKSQ